MRRMSLTEATKKIPTVKQGSISPPDRARKIKVLADARLLNEHAHAPRLLRREDPSKAAPHQIFGMRRRSERLKFLATTERHTRGTLDGLDDDRKLSIHGDFTMGLEKLEHDKDEEIEQLRVALENAKTPADAEEIRDDIDVMGLLFLRLEAEQTHMKGKCNTAEQLKACRALKCGTI